jgi:hypothetical protein
MPARKLEMLLEKSEKGTVATGPVEYFSDDWLVGLGFQNYRDWLNDNMKSGNIWTDLYMECPIPSPAWMIHREDLNRIGAFHSELIPEDYDLCFRIYEHGLKVAVCNDVVHRWRDSQERTSRKNPDYFPMAYYPLKVHYFLKLEKDEDDVLFLWGAGKKGKLIAQILKDQGVKFHWVTDNKNKIGQDIHGVIVEEVDFDQQIKAKTIIAVASPDDKSEIQELLNLNGFDKNKHYWWFC